MTFQIPIKDLLPTVYGFSKTFTYTFVLLNGMPMIDLASQPSHDPIFFVTENLEILIEVSDPEGDTIIGLPSTPLDSGSITPL